MAHRTDSAPGESNGAVVAIIMGFGLIEFREKRRFGTVQL